jgi:uncharacterized protein (DUF1015 family)
VPEVYPFTGLLYAPTAGAPERLTAPPYDAISEDERERLLEASPHNVVRLILGKDESGDDDVSNKYTRAARWLREWVEQGVLVPTAEESVYAYEMAFRFGGADRTVRGLIVAVGLEPFGRSIVPHEETMPGPIEDRLRLLRATGANLSPIYGVLRGPCEPQRRILEGAASRAPDRETVDEQGVRHRMWVEPGVPPELGQAYATETLLIADGHHRYTTALAYRDEMRARHGPGPWDLMMMLVVDAATEDPPVLPIHRVVTGSGVPAPGFEVPSLDRALALVDDDAVRFAVALPDGDGAVALRVAELQGEEPPTVCALHDRILSRYPDATLEFVPDPERAVAAVREGASLAYLLPPTHVERIRRVIERGDRLPQKSTWFWPKPRTGMVIRPLA